MKWINIDGIDKYLFNNEGDVYSISQNKIRKYHIKRGYYVMTLTIGNKVKMIGKHQIVYKVYNNGYKLFNGSKIVIDHIDEDRSNNNINNLRELPNGVNANRSRTYKSGLPVGVIKSRGSRYVARIKINGITKYIGTYDTPEEASSEYQKKLKQI